MPNPTAGDVHVNRPLTNVSIATIQDAKNFIASTVFPLVPVEKQSDAYFVYDNAYWNRDEMTVRAPGTESAGNGYKIDGTPTYFAPIYGFHRDVPDAVRANADIPINLDKEATSYVTLKSLIKREKLFVANFMATSVWTYDYVGGSSATTNQILYWSSANSTPIEDVWDAKASILSKTGFEPNTLVLGYQVFKKLVNHAEVIDRVKYGGYGGTPGVIGENDLAQLFKVEKVVVMKGIENTALEAATATHAFIGGGKDAALFYAAPSPGIMTPSAGYIFSWTGYLGAGPDGNRIKRFRMENLASDRIEIEIAFDMKKISADLGAFWSGAVA